MVERLLTDSNSVVDPEGDILPSADFSDELDISFETPEEPDLDEPDIITPPEHAESAADHGVEVADAKRFIARVEDEAEKIMTSTGISASGAEEQALDRLGVSQEDYVKALELVYGKKEETQQALGARSIIEALRKQQLEGLSPAERSRQKAIDVARKNRNPRVGPPRF